MPLLKPVGEKIAASPAVAWMKNAVHTAQSPAFMTPPEQHDWVESGGVARRYFKSHLVDSENTKSSKGRPSDEQGIYVSGQLGQHTYLSNDSLEIEP